MKSTWHHRFGHELQEDNSPHTHKAVKGTRSHIYFPAAAIF